MTGTPMLSAALLLAAQLTVAGKPIVVFNRPTVCSPCDVFENSGRHPAMQRRLASVVFETERIPDLKTPSIVVLDASRRELMSWVAIPTWLFLHDVLTAIDKASPYLGVSDDGFENERNAALVALAFGDEARGKALLETMRSSQSSENRELAAVWLERLGAMRSDHLTTHARTGSTNRVRFEAFMALGDAHVKAGAYEKGVEAFDRAVALAPAKSQARHNALAARQNATDYASPVLGLSVPGTVIAGRKTIQPRTLGKSVARVEFKLDGKTVATARRRPFATGIDFARIPTRQVLEVIARDRKNAIVSRSSVVVNERSEAFAVDFLQPSTWELAGAVDVEIAARVPRGRSVEQLIVEWNGSRVARFTAPPYRTRIDVPAGEAGILRAVLRLDDGSEVEDAVLANSGGTPYESGAHLVEVPAYFNGPTSAPSAVTVRESGQARPVERVIPPADAPLVIGLVIDSSESMIPHMLDVQEAAVRFVEENLAPRDRAMIVGFTSNVRVVLRPTADRERIEHSILSLRPKGGTALYDGIVNALLQMRSPESRKAIVVFSDGLDGSSVLTAEAVAEVARRSGVPIYVLSFGGEAMANVSTRTGGKSFAMRSLDELPGYWSEIGADLRRQSLVIYRTDTSGAEWRTLEITAQGQRVRAPSGVYVTALLQATASSPTGTSMMRNAGSFGNAFASTGMATL
ncbi:MAG TPA: VWA domain-containing protein [Thermoanaerobaculia bacterium]|nr:VWA domain-containing protein [Thermoanaerobaculia bacterium]